MLTAATSAGRLVSPTSVTPCFTTILPLSLVLKEMHLPTAIYEGSHVEPASVTK